MKRILSLFLATTLMFSLISCGGNDSSSAVASSESGGGIEVDENLLSVDITLPAFFFEDEDMSTFDGATYAAEQGFNSAKLNDDGSVSINMSKAKHKELMTELKDSVESTFSEMIGAEDTPYIQTIDYSDSFYTVDIVVDKAGYESGGLTAAFIPFLVYMPVSMYQLFDGADAAKCEISIIDGTTNEVLESYVYPDALNDNEDGNSDKSFDESAYSFTEQVLVDNDICTMVVTGIEPNGDWGFSFNVYCENKSNKNLGFSLSDVSVNGYMCDPFWGTTIPAGKKENGSFDFSKTKLNKLGIDVINEVVFNLKVYDSDDWSADGFVFDTFSIYPTGLSASDVIYDTRSQFPGEVVCVDDNNCTFIIESVDPNGDHGYTLNCYLENKTDKYLQFSWDDVSVNGYMCDPFWGTEVAPGKRALSEISFYESEFEKNSIDTVTEIEYTLKVYDSNDWRADNLVDSIFSYKPNI